MLGLSSLGREPHLGRKAQMTEQWAWSALPCTTVHLQSGGLASQPPLPHFYAQLIIRLPQVHWGDTESRNARHLELFSRGDLEQLKA